jgi:hypothetical protein
MGSKRANSRANKQKRQKSAFLSCFLVKIP